MSDELLKEAQANLHLSNIYLREINTKLADGFVPALMKGEREFKLQNKIGTKEHITLKPDGESKKSDSAPKFIEYHVSVGARVVDGDMTDDELSAENIPSDKIIAEIECTFAVLYQLEKPVSEDGLREFGVRNAPYHVWPYWRELLHSTGNRMDLAGMILPMLMYKPPSKSEMEEKSSKK